MIHTNGLTYIMPSLIKEKGGRSLMDKIIFAILGLAVAVAEEILDHE